MVLLCAHMHTNKFCTAFDIRSNRTLTIETLTAIWNEKYVSSAEHCPGDLYHLQVSLMLRTKEFRTMFLRVDITNDKIATQ